MKKIYRVFFLAMTFFLFIPTSYAGKKKSIENSTSENDTSGKGDKSAKKIKKGENKDKPFYLVRNKDFEKPKKERKPRPRPRPRPKPIQKRKPEPKPETPAKKAKPITLKWINVTYDIKEPNPLRLIHYLRNSKKRRYSSLIDNSSLFPKRPAKEPISAFSEQSTDHTNSSSEKCSPYSLSFVSQDDRKIKNIFSQFDNKDEFKILERIGFFLFDTLYHNGYTLSFCTQICDLTITQAVHYIFLNIDYQVLIRISPQNFQNIDLHYASEIQTQWNTLLDLFIDYLEPLNLSDEKFNFLKDLLRQFIEKLIKETLQRRLPSAYYDALNTYIHEINVNQSDLIFPDTLSPSDTLQLSPELIPFFSSF